MLHENEPAQAVNGLDCAKPKAFDRERWTRLRNRLIDELAKGSRPLEHFAPEDMELGRLKIWLKSPDSFPDFAWRLNEKPTAERIAENLEQRFAELDKEGLDHRQRCPARVETNVTRALIEGAETARNLCEWVDFCAAPGLGKTEAKTEYIARMRKADGFFCPVWAIDLDETCVSPKAVLNLIAREVLGAGRFDEKSEFAMSQAIIEATSGQRGLLFVDEGQHLADVLKKMGVPIINLLRRFVDRGCFGIVYLGNGEIYRRLNAGIGRDRGAYTQLLSRMQDFRIEVSGYRPGKPKEGWALSKGDVLAVAQAWGVTGVEEAAYCLKIAEGPGALRAMTNILRMALERYDGLDIKSLNRVRSL